MATRPYHLAPYVHWRTAHGFAVILDCNGDKYYSIPARQFEALLTHVDCGGSTGNAQPYEPPPDVTLLMNELLAQGILTSTPIGVIPVGLPDAPTPERLISTWDTLLPLSAALPYAPIFFYSCALADYHFRFKSLRQITDRIARRKRGYRGSSLERSIYLTRVFHALRPFYPHSYLCLFDSLALLEFLAHWRLFPSLVFGVTIDPFEAHCWVQHDTTVLCDTASFSARWFLQIWTL
jgi:Transglutaminase-like superfamily